jgi:hypothetical protein
MKGRGGEHRAMFVVVDYAYPSSWVASKRHCDYLTGLWLVKRFLYRLQRKLQPSRGDRFGFCQRLHSRKRLSGRKRDCGVTIRVEHGGIWRASRSRGQATRTRL